MGREVAHTKLSPKTNYAHFTPVMFFFNNELFELNELYSTTKLTRFLGTRISVIIIIPYAFTGITKN